MASVTGKKLITCLIQDGPALQSSCIIYRHKFDGKPTVTKFLVYLYKIEIVSSIVGIRVKASQISYQVTSDRFFGLGAFSCKTKHKTD